MKSYYNVLKIQHRHTTRHAIITFLPHWGPARENQIEDRHGLPQAQSPLPAFSVPELDVADIG